MRRQFRPQIDWTQGRKPAGREGKTTMALITNTANSTPEKSGMPWIHVRASLIKKLWMGLAVFSTGGTWTALPGQQQFSFAYAAGA